MSDPARFLFDTVFEVDDDGIVDGVGAEMPSRVARYSEDDLAAACAEAEARGREAGAAAEREASARRLAVAAEAIAGQLTGIAEAQAAVGECVMREGAALAVAVARRVVPALMARAPGAEIEALVGDTLRQLIDEPRVVVRVADEVLDPLRERLEAIATAAGFEGRMVMLGEPAMAPGDCQLEWADGGVERDAAAIWARLDAALARLLDDDPA